MIINIVPTVLVLLNGLNVLVVYTTSVQIAALAVLIKPCTSPCTGQCDKAFVLRRVGEVELHYMRTRADVN